MTFFIKDVKKDITFSKPGYQFRERRERLRVVFDECKTI